MRCRWVWQGPQASQCARVRRAFGKRVRRPVCAPVARTWLMKSRPNPWKANSCVFYAGIYFIFSWTFPRCRTPCLRNNNNNNNSKRLHNWPIRERGVGAHVTAVAAPPGAGASPWCHPETVGFSAPAAGAWDERRAPLCALSSVQRPISTPTPVPECLGARGGRALLCHLRVASDPGHQLSRSCKRSV